MEVTTKGTTNNTTDTNGTQTKTRKRVNPRAKMVKALHSILGEQIRENDWEGAKDTLKSMSDYAEELNNA